MGKVTQPPQVMQPNVTAAPFTAVHNARLAV